MHNGPFDLLHNKKRLYFRYMNEIMFQILLKNKSETSLQNANLKFSNEQYLKFEQKLWLKLQILF